MCGEEFCFLGNALGTGLFVHGWETPNWNVCWPKHSSKGSDNDKWAQNVHVYMLTFAVIDISLLRMCVCECT